MKFMKVQVNMKSWYFREHLSEADLDEMMASLRRKRLLKRFGRLVSVLGKVATACAYHTDLSPSNAPSAGESTAKHLVPFSIFIFDSAV